MSHVRAVAWGSIAVLLGIALSVVPPATVSATSTIKGTLTMTPAMGAPGTTVALVGTIAPRVKHRVKLQRRDGGTFSTLAVTNTDGRGSRLRGHPPDWSFNRRPLPVLSPQARDPGTGKQRSLSPLLGPLPSHLAPPPA